MAKTPMSELTYGSYRHNRRLFPHWTPEQWKQVYGEDVRAYERRFQQDQAAYEQPVEG